jgi:hypothetical protein
VSHAGLLLDEAHGSADDAWRVGVSPSAYRQPEKEAEAITRHASYVGVGEYLGRELEERRGNALPLMSAGYLDLRRLSMLMRRSLISG